MQPSSSRESSCIRSSSATSRSRWSGSQRTRPITTITAAGSPPARGSQRASLAVAELRRAHLLRLDDQELALHLVRLDAAALVLVGVVEKPDKEQTRGDESGDRRDQAGLHDEALAPVREQEREPDRHEGPHDEDEPDRRRQLAVGLAETRAAGVGSLVLLLKELQKGGLLGRPGRVDVVEPALQTIDPALHRLASLSVLHGRPLLVNHSAAVTDQAAFDGIPLCPREEVGGARELHHGDRILLGTGLRVVEALEGLEHDEREEHGERRAEEREDPGAPLHLDEEVVRLRAL